MGNPVDWQQKFETEIRRGEKARRDGNEGMARVCARRAAGHAVRAYISRQNISLPQTSYTALQYLKYISSAENMDEAVRNSAANFVRNITPEHAVPGDVDLLKEAWVLRRHLFKEKSSDE